MKAEVQEDHAREVHPGRQDGFLEMRKEMKMWEDWCQRQKRKNSQGKDPRTFEENRQGKDPSTLERNSQGKDPRTPEAPVKKVAGSEKAKRKEVEKEDWEKEETSEAQKKQSAKNNLRTSLCQKGKKKKIWRKKRQRVE